MHKFIFYITISFFYLTIQAQNAVPFLGKKGLWGFKVGNQITIPCRYTEVEPFSEGMARVKEVSKGYKGAEIISYGYVDSTGLEAIRCIYISAEDFSDGLAFVGLSYGHEHGYAFIDKSGKVAFYPDISRVGVFSSFSEGYAVISKRADDGYRYGYADKNGRMVIAPVLVEAGPFKNGLAEVKDANGKPCTIDTTFYRVGTKSYIMPISWQKGSNGKYGLTNGVNTLTEPVYDAVEAYADGYSAVQQDGKWGVVNPKGREVLAPICSAIDPPYKNSKVLVQEDFIMVHAKGKMALISATRDVESPLCDEVKPMYKGLAMITLDKTKGWQYADRDMKPVDLSSGIALQPLYASQSEPKVFQSAYTGLSGVGLRMINDVLIIPYYESIEYRSPFIVCRKGTDSVLVFPNKLTPENSDLIEINELEDVECEQCNGSGREYSSSVVKGGQTSSTTINKTTSYERDFNTKTGQYDGYTKTRYTPVTTYSQNPDKVVFDSSRCLVCNGKGTVKGKKNKHIVWDGLYHRYVKE